MNLRINISNRGWITLVVMLAFVALSRIDSPSPKILFAPLRVLPGDSDVNKKVLDVFREKGRDYPVYEALHFSGMMKHQYPPTIFVLYWPLAFVSQATYSSILDVFSRSVFILGAFLTILIFELSWKMASPDGNPVWVTQADKILGRFSLFVVIIFFYPYQISLHQLQAQTMITTIFILLLFFELSGKPELISGRLGGLLMGIAASLKPQYGLYAVWGLIRRKFSFAVVLISVAALVGIATILMFGWGNTATFYFRVLPDLSKRGEAYFPNQSMNGLLNRLYTQGMNVEYSYTEYPPEYPVVVWGTRVALVILVGIGLLTKRSQAHNGLARALDLAFVGLAFTMAGTIAWEHYYGVLIAISAVLLPVLIFQPGREGWILPAFVTSFLMVGVRWWQTMAFADHGVLTILQSNIYIGALLLLGLLYVARRRYGSPSFPIQEDRR
jgi:alpha-1,2-mannosyltransferase